MKFESKYKIFIPKNASENIVCEMAAILSRGGGGGGGYIFQSYITLEAWAVLFNIVAGDVLVLKLKAPRTHTANSVPPIFPSSNIEIWVFLMKILLGHNSLLEKTDPVIQGFIHHKLIPEVWPVWSWFLNVANLVLDSYYKQ